MAKKPRTPKAAPPPRWYRGADVPMAVIRRFARQVAERFQPEKIILFGSYAYGTPNEYSDVDMLVIMPCRNAINQSIRIGTAFERPFSLDLIVRTPYQIRTRLKPDDCDWFLGEIIENCTFWDLLNSRHECDHAAPEGFDFSRYWPGRHSGLKFLL